MLVRTPLVILTYMPVTPDIATCMRYTGVDPMTGRPVEVARHLKDRRLQRALMQFFKPGNWFHRPRGTRPGRPHRT